MQRSFPSGSTVKNPSAVQETQVRSLGWEDPLGKEMATLSNILAWRIPWMEESAGLTTGTQRVGHDLETKPPPQYLRWYWGALLSPPQNCHVFLLHGKGLIVNGALVMGRTPGRYWEVKKKRFILGVPWWPNG